LGKMGGMSSKSFWGQKIKESQQWREKKKKGLLRGHLKTQRGRAEHNQARAMALSTPHD